MGDERVEGFKSFPDYIEHRVDVAMEAVPSKGAIEIDMDMLVVAKLTSEFFHKMSMKDLALAFNMVVSGRNLPIWPVTIRSMHLDVENVRWLVSANIREEYM